jgi:pimeloyl-ACP methyl ester carboxylesterase
MNTVESRDGTAIAFEKAGRGPALILVDGALCYRGAGPSKPVAAELSADFTVYTYDRRGRGESGDAAGYAVAREVEDLAALIEEAGGSARLCGFSSGAVLALQAANRGLGVEKLALYEPPFIVDDSRAALPSDYAARLDRLLAAGRRGDALRLFMGQVGMPKVLVALMRFMPAWSKLKSVAPTLRYDAAVMGDTQSGRALPAERWSAVSAPTLVIVGGKSPGWMQNGTRALAELLPNAERRSLEGQTHMVKAKPLAPLLTEFLAGAGRAPGGNAAADRAGLPPGGLSS